MMKDMSLEELSYEYCEKYKTDGLSLEEREAK
jgi:hypothetical protein